MDINFFIKSFINSNSYLEQFDILKSSAVKEEYLSIFVYLCFATFLGLLIISLSYFLVTQSPETEKLSTYECGFDPYGDTREQFNIRFYIIAILFVLFDIEIIFMLPWCLSLSQLDLLGFWSMVEFLAELGIGFIYVWCVGAIEWS
jgi:NADH-quinone oxidoreductase subunit A|uniref:NADH-ubiquinone oxidoreductase chain 3 n=1 Tax=Pseudo-nitzschia cuspidata TaxID=237455 RepID=A0A888TCN5_9STRA|nr:NADH dehydrogenase subunit 3 [Pseudo-nitzschia cuspidata]QRC12189.1 NADH dehydrogenase subunit 3 [Pseudo-nitzschia cuspidata]